MLFLCTSSWEIHKVNVEDVLDGSSIKRFLSIETLGYNFEVAGGKGIEKNWETWRILFVGPILILNMRV